MIYSTEYSSPIGPLLLVSDGENLIGIWMKDQKHFADNLNNKTLKRVGKEELIIFNKVFKWLDSYFEGENPKISDLPLEPKGTEFRKSVWDILLEIPYGKTITYGEIAKNIAKQMNKEKMSSQAIGGAVGHNPISIIIPCHRVVGKDGSLTGYAGGIDKKIKLLKHENVDMSKLYVPKKGTAL